MKFLFTSSVLVVALIIIVTLSLLLTTTSSEFKANAQAISPLPGFPSKLPSRSQCFSHASFVVCIGGNNNSNNTGGDTLTAFYSLTTFNHKNFVDGPTLKGISISGRGFAALAGNYLVVCLSCGGDAGGDVKNRKPDDRLIYLDVAYVHNCLFVRGDEDYCSSPRMQFQELVKLPSSVSKNNKRLLASIVYVPYVEKEGSINYGTEKGALLIAGGVDITDVNKITPTNVVHSVGITLQKDHVVLTTSGAGTFVESSLPTSFVANMTDAPVAAFPLLERVIFFYNATVSSGIPGKGATYTSYLVGKLSSKDGKLSFYAKNIFPGFLAPLASSNEMTNVVVDGHLAIFAVPSGHVWITDASETTDSFPPSQAKQYSNKIDVGTTDTVSTLIMIPPGTDAGLNTAIVLSYIIPTRDPKVAISLYPSSAPAVMRTIKRVADRVVVDMRISCFYRNSRAIRIAVSSDCSTPVAPETSAVLCSDQAPISITFNMSVERTIPNVVVCVDRGRCPFGTHDAPAPVTKNTAACPALVSTLSDCMEQACCVNFGSPSINSNICLAPFSKSSGFPSEFVMASDFELDFPRTMTLTKTPHFNETTSTTTSPTTTTSLHPPPLSSTEVSTTTSGVSPSETATSNSSNNNETSTTENPNFSTTTINIETTTTESPTPGPGGNNNNNNNNNLNGLKVPIIASASGICFVLLIIFGYVVYKRREDEASGGGGSSSKSSPRDGGGGNSKNSNYGTTDNFLGSGRSKKRGANSNETTPRIRPKPGSNDPMSIIPQFAVVSKIGRGGFCDVYSVRRKTDGEVYALKVYRLQMVHDSSDEDQHQQQNLLNAATASGAIQSFQSGRANSELSDAFARGSNATGASSPIVRVAQLQKVGALAFKEQRLMRKLHRETHGRVVKPIEVYVHGSMEAPSRDNPEEPPELNLNSSISRRTSSLLSPSASTSMAQRQASSSSQSYANAHSRGNINASAVSNSPINQEKFSPKNSDDPNAPLLQRQDSGNNNNNNNNKDNSNSNANNVYNNNTAELATTTGDTREDSPENKLIRSSSLDPALPITYGGSIVAGLFELVPDGNFACYLKSFRDRNKPVPIKTVLRVLCQLADVLHIMGNRSAGCIVHGDVKGENILLKISQGMISLGDFGTAVEFRRTSSSAAAYASSSSRAGRPSSRSNNNNSNANEAHVKIEPPPASPTKEGPLMGKALSIVYSAPERVQGVVNADPCLDWWSFGVLIYLSFAPKGKHCRSMAVDVARAHKQSSVLEATGSPSVANNNSNISEQQNKPSPTGSNEISAALDTTDNNITELHDELVQEVVAAGCPEKVARKVMLQCLNLRPDQRLKMSSARDILQISVLELFPEAASKMENGPTPGLYESPFPFELTP